MTERSNDWLGKIFDEIDQGLKDWNIDWGAHWRGREGGPRGWGTRRGRGRRQFFESGDMKYLILRLIREKPSHGYEIIKALEEKMGGCYTPSAGTVYPTLQLLEDQGYVRSEETDGKKVYSITPEGEAFLDEHKGTIEEILSRVRDAVRDVAGGRMGELNQAFARLARLSYRWAWRRGPDDEVTGRMIEILRRAADEIRALHDEADQRGEA